MLHTETLTGLATQRSLDWGPIALTNLELQRETEECCHELTVIRNRVHPFIHC